MCTHAHSGGQGASFVRCYSVWFDILFHRCRHKAMLAYCESLFRQVQLQLGSQGAFNPSILIVPGVFHPTWYPARRPVAETCLWSSFPFHFNFHGVFCYWMLLMKALAFSHAQNTDAWQVSDLPQLCNIDLQELGKWWAQSRVCTSCASVVHGAHREGPAPGCSSFSKGLGYSAGSGVSSSHLPASHNLQCRICFRGK